MTGVIEHFSGGAALAAALESFDVSAADDVALADQVVAARRLAAWAASVEHDAVVELARRPPDTEDPAQWAEPGEQVRPYLAEELAPRLRTSTRSVENVVELACALTRRLPEARAALRTGALDLPRVRVLAAETATLEDKAARRVDETIVLRAVRMTPSRLRRAVRATVLQVDATAAEKRVVRAVADRYVAVTPLDDGMAELYAKLPAADALRIHGVLTAAAKRMKSDDPLEDRTLDQRRADILCATFRDAAQHHELLGAPIGAGCEIQVTVSATTLLGLDEEPGALAGYGPITAGAVRELEPGSRLRRLLVEPVTAKVLDVGTTSYPPTADIARHVKADHPRCTFPTCNQPAARCELDHVVPFPDGPTSVDNLRPRCKRHHLLKHHPGVHVEELPDGTTRWHLPTGSHDNEPEPPI